jgi:hypothetical protein
VDALRADDRTTAARPSPETANLTAPPMSENGNTDADDEPIRIDLSVGFSAGTTTDWTADPNTVSDRERLEAFVRKAERGEFGADSDLTSAVRTVKLLLEATKTDTEE